MLSNDMKGLNHVIVEVIKTPYNSISDVECGAFMGVYKCENGTEFVVLKNKEDSVCYFNVSQYGIMTVQAENSSFKYMTCFTKDDQEKAKELLLKIADQMKEEKRIVGKADGNIIIDAETYKNVPKSVFTDNSINNSSAGRSTSSSTTTKSTTAVATTTYSKSTGSYSGSGYNYYKTPDPPKALLISRKGRLPSKERLDKMRLLVRALREEGKKIVVPVAEYDRKNNEKETQT